MPTIFSATASRTTLAALGGLLLAAAAWAGEDDSLLSLSGYGTVGAVYHDRAQVEYRRDTSQHLGAKGKDVSFLPDSMLAVQLTARPSDRLQAAVQMVSRNAAEHNYHPETAWAYVKFKPSEELSLRAGRLGADMFLQGDSTEIGFANLSIRQPLYFYPRTYDGVDAEWSQPMGAGLVRVKAMAGHMMGKVITSNQPPYDVDGSPIVGGMAEYSQAGWTARLSTGRLVYKHEFAEPGRSALATLLSYVPNGAEIMAGVTMKDRPVRYYSADLVYDSGNLRGSASFVKVVSTGWQDQNMFNALLGYRMGKYTPYVGFHQSFTNRRTVPSGIPWGLSAPTDTINAAVEGVQGAFKQNERDLTLGVRYDISRTLAAKLQADLIGYRDSHSIYDPQQFSERFADRKWRRLSLVSAALEFVF